MTFRRYRSLEAAVGFLTDREFGTMFTIGGYPMPKGTFDRGV